MIHDDGTICRIDDGRFYLTVTTSGAEEAESWMLDWREAWGHDGLRRQPDLVARRDQRRRAEGARGAREADRRRHLDRRASRTSATGTITVAGVPCLAMRLGFVGEVARSCTTRRRAPRSCGRRCSRPARRGTSARSASRPSACCGSRRATSSSRRTPTSRRRRGSVGMQWAVKLDKAWLRRQGARSLRGQERTTESCSVPWRCRPGTAPAGGRGGQGRRQARRPRHGSLVLPVARPSDRARLGASRELAAEGRASLIGKDDLSASVVKATPSTTRRGRSSVPELFTVHDAAKVRVLRPPRALDALARAGRRRARPHRAATRSCASAPPAAPSELLTTLEAAARSRTATARAGRRPHATAGRSSRSAATARDERVRAASRASALPADGRLLQGSVCGVAGARSFCRADRVDVIVTAATSRWYVGDRLEHAGHAVGLHAVAAPAADPIGVAA